MNAHAQNEALARRLYNAIPPAAGECGRLLPVDLARTLRRAQMTLHSWSEEMCNGTIQREGPDGDGKPFRVWDGSIGLDSETKRMKWGRNTHPTPDREAGALRRIEQVCKEAGLSWYYQRDPRGCALFVAAFPLDHSNYDRGVACL